MSDDYQNESYINLPLVKMNKRRRKYCMKTALCEPPEEITKFRDLSHFSLSEGNSTSCWFFDWAIWQTRWQVTAEKTAGVRHYPSFIWKNSIVSLTLQCSSTCWSGCVPNIVSENRTGCFHGVKLSMSTSHNGIFCVRLSESSFPQWLD